MESAMLVMKDKLGFAMTKWQMLYLMNLGALPD